MSLRTYVWTQKEIDAYIKMKDRESLELLKAVSGSVEAAMTALGDELFKYLEQAGEEQEKKESSVVQAKRSVVEKLLGDFIDIKKNKKKKVKPLKLVPKKEMAGYDGAREYGTMRMFFAYKNFKKAHRMIMW